MKLLELEDRLYTSTEVAKILGVSLRSVYRYLEDAKLDAEMKTATGRHRFTKQNILDFLSPQQSRQATRVAAEGASGSLASSARVVEAPVSRNIPADVDVESAEEEVANVAETSEDDEEVDWLAKFRAAAAKYKADEVEEAETVEEEVEDEPQPVSAVRAERQSVSGLADMVADTDVEEEEVEEEPSAGDEYYYTSAVGGLKDIAQNLDKSARKASLDYAFTMDSGLSLHKPIRPFSVIHSYVRSEDLPFFEKILNLNSASRSEAQLCLVVSDSDEIYSTSKEMHGLKVVSDAQLRKDLLLAGEEELAGEI